MPNFTEKKLYISKKNMTFTDFLVIFFFFLFTLSGFIINFVRGEKKKNIQYTKDKKSLTWFRILVPIGLVASEVFYFSEFGLISNSILFVIIGCVLIIFGFVVRWFAVLSLGKKFNVSLSIIKKHKLKTDGIYKYIRHPSYTGLLIYYLGLSIIMQNIFSIILLVIFPIIAVINRIKIEENMLFEYFRDEYQIYKQKTKKLFPFIY